MMVASLESFVYCGGGKAVVNDKINPIKNNYKKIFLYENKKLHQIYCKENKYALKFANTYTKHFVFLFIIILNVQRTKVN